MKFSLYFLGFHSADATPEDPADRVRIDSQPALWLLRQILAGKIYPWPNIPIPEYTGIASAGIDFVKLLQSESTMFGSGGMDVLSACNFGADSQLGDRERR